MPPCAGNPGVADGHQYEQCSTISKPCTGGCLWIWLQSDEVTDQLVLEEVIRLYNVQRATVSMDQTERVWSVPSVNLP